MILCSFSPAYRHLLTSHRKWCLYSAPWLTNSRGMNLLYRTWGCAQKHPVCQVAKLPTLGGQASNPQCTAPVWHRHAEGKGTNVVGHSLFRFMFILPSPLGGDGPSLSLSSCSLFSFSLLLSPPQILLSPPPTHTLQQQNMKLIYPEDLIKPNICMLNWIVEK